MNFSCFRKAAGPALADALPTALILCYHRVSEDTLPDPAGLRLHPLRFLEHLQELSRWPTLALSELFGPSHRGPAVALTFDDGYRDALTVIAPLLQERKLAATFFVTTNLDRPYWWDQLAASGCWDRAKRYPEAGPEERAELLEDCPGSPELLPPRLNLEELRCLASLPGVEIGGHTATHPLLRHCPPHQLEAELSGSRRLLESWLGQPVPRLAYPHGTPPRNLEAVVRAGYSHAYTVFSDRAWSRDHPLRVPRIPVGDWTRSELKQRLEAFFL